MNSKPSYNSIQKVTGQKMPALFSGLPFHGCGSLSQLMLVA